MEALNANQPEEAARQLKEQIWRDPSNAFAYAALGVALAQMGDTGGALEALERAHYIQPGNPQILYNYGLALQSAGRLVEARLRFQAALKVDPRYERAWRRLAALPDGSGSVPRELPTLGEPAAPSPSAASAPQTPPPSTPPPSPAPVTRLHTDEPGVIEATIVAEEVHQPGADRYPAAWNPAAYPPQPPSGPGDAGAAPQTPPVGRRRLTAEDVEWLRAREAKAAADTSRDREEVDAAPPGFLELARAVLQLWGEQPLLWLGLLLLPNALAAALSPAAPGLQWAAGLIWTAALGLAAAPLLTALAGQWINGRPFSPPWQLSPGRLASGMALALPLLLLALGPFCVLLGLRSAWSGDVVLLGMLFLTAPLHALLAPALVTAATDGPTGWAAVRKALASTRKRTWIHLALMLLAGALTGAVLVGLGVSFAPSIREGGETLRRVLQVAGVSFAESVWAVLVTICGVDTLAVTAAPAPGEEPAAARDDRRDDRRDPVLS